jgi:ribosome recycling factor
MNEELKFIIDSTNEEMQNTVGHLKRDLSNIRAGKASPNMLKGVMVDYYGSQTPLSQVANVNTPDAQTISVQPWEKTLIPEIEKGIMLANLGFNPSNNGESVIINVPPLTEERRKDLAKAAKSATENDKISVRNARKDANNEIKNLDISDDMKKNGELSVQELTDKYIKQMDEIFKNKEVEIMTV